MDLYGWVRPANISPGLARTHVKKYAKNQDISSEIRTVFFYHFLISIMPSGTLSSLCNLRLYSTYSVKGC